MFKTIIFLLFLSSSFIIFPDDFVINKILYKKIIVSYNQEVLINVFLNPMEATDVIVYFNDIEIEDIKKNFNPYSIDNNFLPSFSFYTNNLQDISLLRIFVVLSKGMVVNSESTLFFKKGVIVDDQFFNVGKDVFFFVEAGTYSDKEEYNITIENPDILIILEKVIDQNIIYFKLKSMNFGTTNISIYKKSDNFKDKILLKTININVVD